MTTHHTAAGAAPGTDLEARHATVQAPPTSRARRFVGRHPVATLMLVFNTAGQGLVLGPTVLLGDAAPPLEVLQSIALVLFLLLPALALVRLSRGPVALRSLLRDTVRFAVHPAWYLLPLVVVPAGILLVNSSLPHDRPVDVAAVAAAYAAGFLPVLAIQFLTTNWWEETVWTGVVQAPWQQRFGTFRGVLMTTPLFALEHAFLVLDASPREAVTLMATLTLLLVLVRAGFGWVYRRSGSLALTGLVHAASNAAVIGLVGRLYDGAADGIVVLAVLGLVVVLAPHGRRAWPSRSA